ncbi:MAG: hypothetical protein WC843_02320 [Candidatus Gracilibacteria bacterium]|jgi:hypothetical protein
MADTLKPDDFEPQGPETAPGQNVPTPEYLEQNWDTLIIKAELRTDQITHEALRNGVVQTLIEQGFNFDPNDQQNAQIVNDINQKIWKSVEKLAKKTIRGLFNGWIKERKFRRKTPSKIANIMATREAQRRQDVARDMAEKGVAGRNILDYFIDGQNEFIEKEFCRLANSGTAGIMSNEPTDQAKVPSTNQDRGLNLNHLVKGFKPEEGTRVRAVTADLLRKNLPTGRPAARRKEDDAYVSLSSVPAALAQAGILLNQAAPTQAETASKPASIPPAAPQAEAPVKPTAEEAAILVAKVLDRPNLVTQARVAPILPPSAAPITRPIAPAAPRVPALSSATTQRLPIITWERRFVSKMNNAWEKVTSAVSSMFPSAKTMKRLGGAMLVAGAGLAVYSGSQTTQTNSETTPQNSAASTPGKPEALTATTATTSTASPNTTATTSAEAKAVDAGTQAAPQNYAPAAQAKTPEQAPTGSTFTIETDPDKNPGLEKLTNAIKAAQTIAKAIAKVAAKTSTISSDRVQIYKAFLEKAVQEYPQGTNGTGHYFEDHLNVLNKLLAKNPNATAADLEKAFEHSLNDRLLFGAIMAKTGPSAPTDKFHFDTTTDQNGDIQFNDPSNLKSFNEIRRGKLAIAKTLEATIKYFEEHPFTSDNFKVCALEFIERAKEIQPGLDKEAAEAKGQIFDPKKKSGAIYILKKWKENIEAGSDARTPIHELMGKIIQVQGKTTQLETAPADDTTAPTFNNFNVAPEKLGILKPATFGPWQTIAVDPVQVGKSGQSKQANSSLKQPQVEKLAQLERDLQIMQDGYRTPVDTVQTAASFKALDVLDRMVEKREAAGIKQATAEELMQAKINAITEDELSKPAKTAEQLMQARINEITKHELGKPAKTAEQLMQARIDAITKDELGKPAKTAEQLMQAKIDAITKDELSKPVAAEKAATPATQELSQDEQLAAIDANWA